MAKLPKMVKVGPYKYSIVTDRTKCRNASKKKDKYLWGETSPVYQTIYLNPDQGADSKADTLLHELLHAVWYHQGMREHKIESEEQIVATLAPGILDVLRRNPKIVEYLVNGES